MTGGNGSGGVVLRRKDIAASPAHFRTEFQQGLDQDRCLDRHVKRAGDPCAFERLRRAELFAQCHQPGHFGFGDFDFLASEIGKAEVLYDKVVKTVVSLRRHVENLQG